MKRYMGMSLVTLPFLMIACGAPVCGDLAVDADNNEQCDDGNAADGDGCAADCTLQTQINTDDIGGQNVSGAVFAIFAENIIVSDLDADGAQDDAEVVIAVLASNDPDLCTKIEAGVDIETIPNLQLALVGIVKEELDSAGTPFASGDSLQGDGESNVALTIIESTSPEGEVFFFAEDNVFGDTGLGLFQIESLDGDTLFATHTAQLRTFSIDNNADGVFDDLNGDGNTQETTNTTFTASFRNAARCDALVGIF